MQNSHPTNHLSMLNSKTLLGICAEVDSQLNHKPKIVLFTKLENGLNSTIYAKFFILDAGFLMRPIIIIPTFMLYHIIYTKYLA